MILDDILSVKLREVSHLYRDYSAGSFVFEPVTEKNRFKKGLSGDGKVSVIAEVKRASPSRGVIKEDVCPAELAKEYVLGGANAVSVLTDKSFFNGEKEDLIEVCNSIDRPVLRKDFIIDELQILESRRMGSDAILLILAVLNDRRASDLMYVADSLDIDCLVEVHTSDELKRALDLQATLIGINNRDLSTFTTDVHTTMRILDTVDIPDDITLVSESGIFTFQQVDELAKYGVDAILVGEALVRSDNPRKLVEEFRSVRLTAKKGRIETTADKHPMIDQADNDIFGEGCCSA